jgi:hypothetical protein
MLQEVADIATDKFGVVDAGVRHVYGVVPIPLSGSHIPYAPADSNGDSSHSTICSGISITIIARFSLLPSSRPLRDNPGNRLPAGE